MQGFMKYETTGEIFKNRKDLSPDGHVAFIHSICGEYWESGCGQRS